MKKLERLGRSLTKKQQKQISGGNGGITCTCDGTRTYQGETYCDYRCVDGCGNEWVLCEGGCWAGCSTIGSVCYIPDPEV